MASSDVIAQNGHFKHPYLLALIRWLVSSVWSSATLLLHRLVTSPAPPVTVFPSRLKPRPASSDHLHPEPTVECVVLHTPDHPTIDVIFVHGLYGSLGNTWRQGEWKSRFKEDPLKIPLRNTNSSQGDEENYCDDEIEDRSEIMMNIGDDIYKNIKILPNDNLFITEKFYNNTLLDQVEIVGNYETQARFVRDLFENDNKVKCEVNKKCDNKCDQFKYDCVCKKSVSEVKCDNENDREVNDCGVKVKCEVGCGCICDDCYSPCWPRDWIKVDYPGARVISINYTSDPHLWRPLWKRASKRLQLHERAEQMMGQLLGLGVGERPIIWVGHSKGGLFIKQIYCEAYEAYIKTKNERMSQEEVDNITNEQITRNGRNYNKKNEIRITYNDNEYDNSKCDNNFNNNDDIVSNIDNKNDVISNIDNDIPNNDNGNVINDLDLDNVFNIDIYNCNENNDTNDSFDNNYVDNDQMIRNDVDYNNQKHLANIPVLDEDSSDIQELSRRSRLWTRSAGFMFYSVPHRGSPLADIKTPITARSVELMEICKDCDLVLSIQERWLRATSSSQPTVRSLVETCKTLMSVLWLRIVSVDSAGSPGIYYQDTPFVIKPLNRECSVAKHETEFQFITRHNQLYKLAIGDDVALHSSPIDVNLITIIYFQNHVESQDIMLFRQVYTQRYDFNLIIVKPGHIRELTVTDSWHDGQQTALFIDYLVSRGFKLSNIHLVGQNIGAQSAVVAGTSFTNGHVHRIAVIDPADMFRGSRLADSNGGHLVDATASDGSDTCNPEPTSSKCSLHVTLNDQDFINSSANKTKNGIYIISLQENRDDVKKTNVFRTIQIVRAVSELANNIRMENNEKQTVKQTKNKIARIFERENNHKINKKDLQQLYTMLTQFTRFNFNANSLNKHRQRRFIPFWRTEASQNQNFVYRIVEFLFRNHKNILPIVTVMREISTIVSSANGELNHFVKETNNYVGTPPPFRPITYNLELDSSSKFKTFLKKLFGLASGDKLTVIGSKK